MIECVSCNGTGRIWYSCCGDDLNGVVEDLVLCPTCHEWCSEDDAETCEDCNGTGILKREPDPNDLYDEMRLTQHFDHE